MHLETDVTGTLLLNIRSTHTASSPALASRHSTHCAGPSRYHQGAGWEVRLVAYHAVKPVIPVASSRRGGERMGWRGSEGGVPQRDSSSPPPAQLTARAFDSCGLYLVAWISRGGFSRSSGKAEQFDVEMGWKMNGDTRIILPPKMSS